MLNKIENIIIECGKKILEFKKNNILIQKNINNHTKTNIDLYADEIIKKNLNKLKKIPIISEENFDEKQERPEEYFIIDPIDGTLSLLNGFKTWVTQIAYIKKNSVLFSAIYEPEIKNLYSGGIEDGIYLNKVRLDKKKINSNKIIFIDNTPTPNEINKKLMMNFPNSAYLECGSLSLKICKVVYGLANVFIKNVKVRDWDIAPPLLLAKLNNVDVFDFNFNNYKLTGNFEKKGLIVCNQRLTEIVKKRMR